MTDPREALTRCPTKPVIRGFFPGLSTEMVDKLIPLSPYPSQATFRIVGLFLAALLLGERAFAEQSYQGKVVHIADGDTLTLLVDYQQVKIRLADIDAPERGQAYGAKAKKVLGNLVFGKRARVEVTAKDRWGRSVGRVYVGGKC